MSLIEQAAQRLEQLRKAGVDVPSQSAETHSHSGNRVDTDKKVASEAPPTFAADNSKAAESETHTSRRIELDLAALSAAGFIRPDAPRSQLADEYRVVKRPLIDNAMGRGAARIKDGNLIMVTSALPGEGKTFTAANLAMSIAMELDNTVMLVDADVARPTLLNKLGLPPMRGLLDVLVDDSIVRGTTSKEIVQMARDAGASKVYLASAAPPVRYPNVYGIDMPTQTELVAHGRSVEEIRQIIGCDALIYQDLESLKTAIHELNPAIQNMDASCFDGIYVTGDINASDIVRMQQERPKAADTESDTSRLTLPNADTSA